MKVAFHAINGVGLGHLVRATCLALALPDAERLVVTNAGDVRLLERHGLDHVRLPPRTSEPHADPDRCLAALPEALEEEVLLATFLAFGADLVVFDTHAPRRVVRALAEHGVRAVLVLRELRPAVLARLAASGELLAFDHVLVPHPPGEVDIAALAGHPVTEAGPIVRALPSPTLPATPHVVALAGGGGQPLDAARYVRAVADAHLLARARFPELRTTLVTGPYGAAPAHVEGFAGLTVRRSPDDLDALLAGATLVVSQAGYNAVAELAALGKPAILVPGHRKSEDQHARARRLARTGAALLARPDARSIGDRIEAVLGGHARLAPAPAIPPANDAAAEVLRRTLARGPAVRKVVLVAHDFAPKLGGMETVARGLAEALVAAGIEVVVYTSSRLGAAAATELPVRVLYRPLPPPGRIDLRRDLLLTLDAALVDRPDVIHLCHAGLAPWIPYLKAALPAVVTAHVHGNDLVAPWVTAGLPDYPARLGEDLGRADAVFAVSAFSRALAASRGVDASVLRTLPNGVDTGRFAPAAGPPEDVLLTVSRLAPRKGHRTVLRALARLARPGLRYVFTGASESLRRELEALAAELGLGGRVEALGFVPDDALPALYRRARVFLLLADGDDGDVEGFGVALLEAAACGVPAVATRTGGIPEAVVDGETGLLVPPGDDAAAAAAIARLLDDPGLARRLGAAARSRVVRDFSVRARAAELLASWTRPSSVTSLAVDPFELGNGVLALRRARAEAAELAAARAARRARLATAIAAGKPVRLRATGEGARLLPEALADCVALGHAPTVEVKLRRLLEPDFVTHALPHVATLELTHGLPSLASPLAALERLPAEALARVGTLRLYLTPEARADARLAVAQVPEAHALRRFFAARGAVVVPPPELMRYLSETPAGGPETAMIEPTNLCNLACPTCPTGTGKIPPLPAMTLPRFEDALAALGPRVRNLALWNYGEPLLNRALPRMIAHAKERGVGVVKVSSNVHFLDETRGRALLRSGLDVLILSVDGASAETYATFRKEGDFDRVAANVAWLCAEKRRLGLARPRIELQFIAMRHNEHELPRIRELARTWGVDRLRIKTVGADDEASRGLVPATRLLSRYAADGATPSTRHAFCTMAWDHAVVNVDGAVTPCCYLRPDMGDEVVMGNVFETEFAAIWRGERYRAFRARMLDGRRDAPATCQRCRGGTHDLLAAVEEVPA